MFIEQCTVKNRMCRSTVFNWEKRDVCACRRDGDWRHRVTIEKEKGSSKARDIGKSWLVIQRDT